MFSLHLPSAVVSALVWSGDNRRLALGISHFDLSAALSGRPAPSEIFLLDATPLP